MSRQQQSLKLSPPPALIQGQVAIKLVLEELGGRATYSQIVDASKRFYPYSDIKTRKKVVSNKLQRLRVWGEVATDGKYNFWLVDPASQASKRVA